MQLILASDLLEDEPEYRFTDDPRLRTPEEAKRLATRVQKQFPGLKFSKLSVLRMRSKDAGKLSPERSKAVDAVWSELLTP